MTTVSTGKILRFYNPIAGKPVPFQLSGLFLLDPATMMKLHGLSMRRVFSEEFDEAFYKKLERVLQGRQRADAKVVLELLDRIPVGVPSADELRAAVNGDVSAQRRMDNRGPWETCFLVVTEDLERMSERERLLISIERASSEPLRLLRSGDFAQAIAVLRADPVISLFLWSDVIDAIEQCRTELQLLPAQAAIATEILLSYVAAVDVELASVDESMFEGLLPGPHAPGKNPTSLFFAHLRDAVGVKTLRAFLDHPKACGLVDLATLKRWSAGSHCPDQVWLRAVLNAFFGDASYPPTLNRYWAARYLSFAGYLAQTVATRARRLLSTSPEHVAALRPWPDYPFGHADCESWMQARYPYWFNHHLKQRQQSSCGTREKRPTFLFS